MPNGMTQASNTFQVVFLNFQCCSIPTLIVFITNNRNSIPCIGPKMEDNMVTPYMRFNGTDIKTNTTSESPSKIAKKRNLPIFEFQNEFISKCSYIWPVGQW